MYAVSSRPTFIYSGCNPVRVRCSGVVPVGLLTGNDKNPGDPGFCHCRWQAQSGMLHLVPSGRSMVISVMSPGTQTKRGFTFPSWSVYCAMMFVCGVGSQYSSQLPVVGHMPSADQMPLGGGVAGLIVPSVVKVPGGPVVVVVVVLVLVVVVVGKVFSSNVDSSWMSSGVPGWSCFRPVFTTSLVISRAWLQWIPGPPMAHTINPCRLSFLKFIRSALSGSFTVPNADYTRSEMKVSLGFRPTQLNRPSCHPTKNRGSSSGRRRCARRIAFCRFRCHRHGSTRLPPDEPLARNPPVPLPHHRRRGLAPVTLRPPHD